MVEYFGICHELDARVGCILTVQQPGRYIHVLLTLAHSVGHP